LAVVAMLSGMLPALAQDKTVTLKMSSWIPPAHPLNPSLIAWAAVGRHHQGDPVSLGATRQGIRPL
jgi:hypothetical protein